MPFLSNFPSISHHWWKQYSDIENKGKTFLSCLRNRVCLCATWCILTYIFAEFTLVRHIYETALSSQHYARKLYTRYHLRLCSQKRLLIQSSAKKTVYPMVNKLTI